MVFDQLSVIEWLGLAAVGIPLMVLTVGFVLTLTDNINTEIGASDVVPQEQKDRLDSLNSSTATLWDYAFLFLFAGVAIVIMAVARSTRVSPFWWVFLLVLLAIISLAAGWMSNVYERVNTDGGLSLSSSLPITHHLATYWLGYILAIGFVALLLSRTGPGGDF